MNGCTDHWLSMGTADKFRRSLVRWRVQTKDISGQVLDGNRAVGLVGSGNQG